MTRRAQLLLMIALFGLSFAVLGKTPRMPEPRGHETLEMTKRESAGRARLSA